MNVVVRPPSSDKQESVRSGLSTPLPPLLPTVTQPQAPSRDPGKSFASGHFATFVLKMPDFM